MALWLRQNSCLVWEAMQLTLMISLGRERLKFDLNSERIIAQVQKGNHDD